MTRSVIAGQFAVAAHDSDQLGADCFLQRRAALYLRDIAAADDAPADFILQFKRGAIHYFTEMLFLATKAMELSVWLVPSAVISWP